MISLDRSRRSFLTAFVALAATVSFLGSWAHAQAGESAGPLLAYVGTFSSPLHDVLPTQVDLPPGNGRGIHIFHVDRATGALAPANVYEMGTTPSCLLRMVADTRLYSTIEADRVGPRGEGTLSAFAVNPRD